MEACTQESTKKGEHQEGAVRWRNNERPALGAPTGAQVVSAPLPAHQMAPGRSKSRQRISVSGIPMCMMRRCICACASEQANESASVRISSSSEEPCGPRLPL
jgi:hypothetical protein